VYERQLGTRSQSESAPAGVARTPHQ